MLLRALRRFARASGGNLAITFAIAALPVAFAFGAAADYGFAVKTRAKMNAAADAAVLAAVTPYVMTQSTSFAQLAAQQMFNTQVSGLTRLNYNANSVTYQCAQTSTGGWMVPTGYNLCVQVTDVSSNNQRIRTAVVAYRGTSSTAFAGVLRMTTIAIAGTSTASAATTPNIDFYLLLDTSPSMAIPSTQAGINQMVSLTPYQGGCAFACHESQPSVESNGGSAQNPRFGNPGCPDDPQGRAGPCQDNYQLAINNNIPLRIQLVNQAVQNLVDTASQTASKTGAAYQLAGYTFDVAVANPIPLQAPTSSTKTQAANGINMLEVAYENSNNGDQNTVFDTTSTTPTSNSSNFSSTSAGAFPYVYNAMTSAYNGAGAGNGTNTPGDHPQQVLMLITDGVSDEPWSSGRIYNPAGGVTNTSSNINDWCTKIKSNSNMRIAVLYLVYNPLPMQDSHGNSSWYAQHVYPIQNDIAPTLQSCASSSSLFTQVNTGGDISTALSNLFQTAVGSAHLSY